ncbi:protein-tyrosine phosphatase [Paenibacillus phyllosphaerae]|uniref:Tyrosine-protein phosphatase n=1 Tax=Paenibacillus phyllosphaerae TaxID=274593 RepID=A0A7W5AY14_9BACL|nr:CpsB/CapC family capsule biosynthesis tyrosine phosphatase [Paenibacillus phyllosphaerae]MBB3110574.1 protein-tyrosine phosphatase [Paenibacillus phyllosphaerae]
MIDIHTHILPGIDDGAVNWEMAMKMAETAVGEGITDVIATPHHANGKYDNYPNDIRALIMEMQQRLKGNAIPLNIHPGQEIRFHEGFLDSWTEQELLTLGQSNYVLIEMPTSNIPSRLIELIHELRIMGIQPIIAHPERNAEVIKHPDRYRELIHAGAYGQVTSHSLLGEFGNKIEKISWELCSEGLIHFVSSDAHNLNARGFRLKDAYEKVTMKLGSEVTDIYRYNAKAILGGEEVKLVSNTYNKEPIIRKFFLKLIGKH